MIDVKRKALEYWQDRLAKFWPTVKGPANCEIEMFEAGYRLANEESARMREALERIAKNKTDDREIYTVGCDCDEEALSALKGKE